MDGRIRMIRRRRAIRGRYRSTRGEKALGPPKPLVDEQDALAELGLLEGDLGANYDPVSGIGVRVSPVQLLSGVAVELVFRSVYQDETHDLTIEQALDLSAALATACRSALTDGA